MKHSARSSTPHEPRAPRRRNLSKFMSVGAMVGAAALLVSTSLPANAFFSPEAFGATTTATRAEVVAPQNLEVGTTVVTSAPTRDAYTVVSLVDELKKKYASQSYSFSNDINGTIQWPFPSGVPITSGFGDRIVAGCSFCTTYHYGVDFTPGAGTPISAIADGVVSEAGTTGAFGNHVMIDHVINGQKVQSLYAHMISGSIMVTVGQQVTVAQQLGLVGSTGDATGPHLHLEIHLDGTPVDPFAWLKANAN